MAVVTVSGGQNIFAQLLPPDVTTLNNALNSLPILTTTNTFNPTSGSYVAGSQVQAIIASGQKSVSITGGTSTKLIVGNEGNDTINATGGTTTIIGATGHDQINISAGTFTVSASIGADTVNAKGVTLDLTNAAYQDALNVTGGTNKVTVSGAGGAPGLVDATLTGGYTQMSMGNGTVNLAAGASANITADATRLTVNHTGATGLNLTLSSSTGPGIYNVNGEAVIKDNTTGADRLNLSGPDTVTLGSGKDTINETGSATVYGSNGLLTYTSTGSGNDSIKLGSGAASVTAGSGSDTIILSSGAAKVYGTTGNLHIQAGRGNSSIVAGSGSDTFGFSTANGGGQMTISGYSSKLDNINLGSGGYTQSDVVSIKLAGGSTTITLKDHTTITLKNFAGPITTNDLGFMPT